MELDEFISSTIKQILDGVREAQISEEHALINPLYLGGKGSDKIPMAKGHRSIQNIKFDVAVVTEDKSDVKGKGKISVLGASLGGSANSEALSKIATRIQFEIPITYPNK